MPELPEVETVRRGLEPVLIGRVLATVIQRRPDLRWPLPAQFAERLQGQRVTRLGRRSKYILTELEGGETWLIHLGMSGKLLIDGVEGVDLHHQRAAPDKHDHVILRTDAGVQVTYNDARRFGAMDLFATAEIDAHPLIAKLGPEPMGNAFNADVLAKALAGKQTPVKAALLDQRVVAGLGNIYVCEALHRSGIHPRRIAGSIGRARVDLLAAQIVATLGDAIAAGGSSLRDYRQADGELGYFQHSFRVYDREGQPCAKPECGGDIRRIVQSGRSSFYCAKCQR
ncbi:MAG: bifunctional DNA-formamidopyrimidine glycosylase/DNA-(apurinic or apyrimidinic site) lyase [Pseudomonadota bacterium]